VEHQQLTQVAVAAALITGQMALAAQVVAEVLVELVPLTRVAVAAVLKAQEVVLVGLAL
jgi:hypothetical protein